MPVRLISKRKTRAKQLKIRSALPSDWRNSLPDRPTRPRRLVNGHYAPVRNTASAKNARSRRVITVRSAGRARLLRFADFDLRSTAGRVYRERVGELVAHLGGADMVTVPMRSLVDQAARLHLLRRIAWDELSKTGPFRHGDARPALAVYQRLAADERDVLRTLGLKRVAREIPRLADVVGGRTP